MRQEVTVVGVADSDPIALKTQYLPFSVSMEVQVVAGVIDATVQYTLDDVADASVTPQWTDHADLASLTAKANGTLVSPVSAVRLSNAGVGSAKLIVIQAGS